MIIERRQLKEKVGLVAPLAKKLKPQQPKKKEKAKKIEEEENELLEPTHIQNCIVTRKELASWCHTPDFEESIIGLLVKVRYENGYTLAKITGTEQDQISYKFENAMTKTILQLKKVI